MRPERQFAKVTDFRAKAIAGLEEAKLKGELRNVNALYSLLDDRYSKKVRCFGFSMRKSNMHVRDQQLKKPEGEDVVLDAIHVCLKM
jgi:hypothetical protein